MFCVDDKVVYGGTGVCRVAGITEMPGRERLYYVLEPLFQSGVIYAPTDGRVLIRPVLSKAEAEAVIERIPGLQAAAYHNANVQALTAHYEAAMKTQDMETLLRLTLSIYAKKQELERQKRKLGQVDSRYMKRAEELIHGELAAALEIPKEEVPEYIARRVAATAS